MLNVWLPFWVWRGEDGGGEVWKSFGEDEVSFFGWWRGLLHDEEDGEERGGRRGGGYLL